MPLTDRKRAIYVALFFTLFLPLLALAGLFYAIVCTEGILHEKLEVVLTIVKFLRFLLKILQDVVIYNKANT